MADLQSRLSQFLKDLYAGVLQINNGSTPNVYELVKVVTGLADASATAVLTVTIPNWNHAAALELTFLSSNGGSDAWESSRTGRGTYVVARVTDAAAVGQAASISITVTIDDSGQVGSNQVVVYARLINANASGVTIA